MAPGLTRIIQLSRSERACDGVHDVIHKLRYTINDVDVNWTVRFDYHQSCGRHYVFRRQRIVVNADDCGGWTQIFGV